MSTALRLLYVEDDPALRGLLAQQLEQHPGVASVIAVGGVQEARDAMDRGIDAAVLDVSLGAKQLNGFELGILLRSENDGLPIVMLSQHAPARVTEVLPQTERHHWSYVEKRARMDVDDLVRVVRDTIDGRPEFDSRGDADDRPAVDALHRLTPRQREVIALAATGLDARAIATQLHLAHVSARRELSRAYKVLVPDTPPGTDLRTAAVLEYLRLTDAVGAGES